MVSKYIKITDVIPALWKYGIVRDAGEVEAAARAISVIEAADVAPLPHWIPVEKELEKLPKQNKPVICYNDENHRFIRVCVLRGSGVYRGFTEIPIWDDTFGFTWNIGDFTHWMPFPVLPLTDEGVRRKCQKQN